MASYVEQATLSVTDNSSAQIKAINAALKDLFQTAQSLKSINIKLNTGNLRTSASSVIKGLNTNLQTLKTTASGIKIKVNSSELTAVARKINALRTAKPIDVKVSASGPAGAPAGIRGRGTGGGGGHGGGGVGQFFHGFGAGIGQATVGITSASIAAIGHAVGHEVAHATMEGTKQVDTANVKAALRGTPKADMDTADSIVADVMNRQRQQMGGAPFANRAETQQFYNEFKSVLPSAKPDEMAEIMMQAITTQRVARAFGMSPEASHKASFDALKVAESTQQLTVRGTTEYDKDKSDKFWAMIRQGAIVTGGQTSGTTLRSVAQSAGVAKYGMDSDALLTMNTLSQEYGSRAGVMINTMMKNLTGNVLVKWKKDNLRTEGLLVEATGPGSIKAGMEAQGKDVQYYKDTKTGQMRQKVKRVNNAGLIEEEAVDEVGLRKNQLKWVVTHAIPEMLKIGMDPTDPGQVSQWAAQNTSGKGVEGLETFVSQNKNLQKELDQAKAVPGSMEAVNKTMNDVSSQINIDSVKTNFESAMGELGEKMAVAAIPIMQKAAGEMSKIAEQIHSGTVDPMTAITGSLAAGGGLLAYGATAGLKAMLSENPSVAALGGAATALDASAAALTASATALGGAAVAQGATGMLGKTGGLLKTGASAIGAFATSGALAPVVAVTAGILEARAISQGAKEFHTLPHPDLDEQRRRFLQMNPTGLKPAPVTIRDLEHTPATATPLPVTIVDSPIKSPAASLVGPVTKDSIIVPPTATPAAAATAMAAPAAGGGMIDLGSSVTDLTAAGNAVSGSISSAAGDLSSSGNTFEAAMSSGATMISSSGAIAAGALTGAAPGIGAAIGNSAANAIRASVSNLSISVNANVNSLSGGANTGSQKAAE